MKSAIFLLGIVVLSVSMKMSGQTIEDPVPCIQEHCPKEWTACEADPKCIPALQDCQKKCGSTVSCWTLCIPGKGSPAAVSVAKCAQANNCLSSANIDQSTQLALFTPEQCIMDKCPDQLKACQRDPKCFPALQDCEKQCGNKTSCWTTCLAGKGDLAASDLWKCINDNDCFNKVQTKSTFVALTDPVPCIKEHCPKEWAACEADPKCIPALQDCQKKCGSTVSCWTLCISGKGSPAAVSVAKCAQANNCLSTSPSVETTAVALTDPIPCIQEHCPTQYAACQKDPKCLPALQDCQKKCGTSQSCWSFCLPGKGSQAAIDVAKCASANHCLSSEPLGFETCMAKSCFDHQVECLSNSECRSFLRECRIKDKVWNFNLECLSERSDISQMLEGWYHCGGQAKCL